MTQIQAEQHFRNNILDSIMEQYKARLTPELSHSISKPIITDPAIDFYNFTFRYNELQDAHAFCSYKVIGNYSEGVFTFLHFEPGIPGTIDKELEALNSFQY